MIIISILFLLFSNTVNVRRDTSTLYNRVVILIFCILNDIFSLAVVTKGIGLFGDLLLNTKLKFKRVSLLSYSVYNYLSGLFQAFIYFKDLLTMFLFLFSYNSKFKYIGLFKTNSVQSIRLNTRKFLAVNASQAYLLSRRAYSTDSVMVAVKTYARADAQKAEVLKENKAKAGVYR